jgi:HPt (histidine-containing phosphotransfer) domain-containing protein
MNDFSNKLRRVNELPLWDADRRGELEKLGQALGKPNYIRELWDVFALSWSTDELDWAEAISKKDWATLRDLAHRLKGASGSVGTSRLYEQFALIQAAIDEIEKHPIQPLLDICETAAKLVFETQNSL